jgi:hypothetical protein
MTAKAKIARYFDRQTGTRLNPLFATSTRCGAVVDLDLDGDVDFLGDLASLGVTVPPLQRGAASFPEFAALRERRFRGSVRASLPEVLPIDASLQARLETAAEVAVEFSSDVEQEYVDIIALSLNIARELEGADRAERRQLRRFLQPAGGNRVIGTVFHGTVRIHATFQSSGSAGFDASYGPAAGDGRYAWRRIDTQTLESVNSVPFAFDAWKWSRNRLRDAS